jgi:hypothetical protein
MSEPDLQELRTDLEQHIDVPDFGLVAARGRRIRRRRRASLVAGAALALGLLGAGVAQQLPSRQSLGPVERPHRPAPNGAQRVLTDPDAQVDLDRSAVNGRGDVLSVVVVPARTFGGDGPCATEAPSAFRWLGSDGATVDWSDASTARPVHALGGRFVVGPVRPRCRTGADGEETAYVVDHHGNQRPLPSHHRPAPVPPAGATAIPVPGGDLQWAQSAKGRRLYWLGARGWRHHDTTLPRSENVTVTVAGDRAAFTTSTAVEATDDGGRTWRVHDLSSALRPVRIADVAWTLTRSGNLIGVTTLVGTGDVVFRSTDASWSRFRRADVATGFGRVSPQVVGGIVYVADVDSWLLSDDDGATWRRVSPLG